MQLENKIIERQRLADLSPENRRSGPSGVLSDADRSGPVVALIPRGEVIRNFVHTGAFDEVAAKTELALLTVSADAEIDKELEARFGESYPLEEYEEKWFVRFHREILDMAHGRWLWSQAAQHRWRMRELEAVSGWQKALRISKKLLCYPFANRAGLNVLGKSERFFSRLLKTTDEYLDLFRQIKPSMVFNGSHIHSRNAIQAVQAAQWLGIPTATFIFSWDNLTSQGRIMLPYDYFFVWNEALRDQLLEMYRWIKPDRVFVTGTPQFDFHFRPEFYRSREEFCAEIGADPARPIVLYSTGMANHMPGEPEIVEEIADLLKEIGGEMAPQLLVRVYPKDLTGRFDEMKNRRRDILFPEIGWEPAWLTPKFEDCSALVNTLRHSALGINVASTISLELCMFDKPVINVGYNPRSVDEDQLSYAEYYDFDHYAPVVQSGAVEVARDRERMREMIVGALERPERLTKERKALIEKMFGDTLDGKSAQRFAEGLLKVSGVK